MPGLFQPAALGSFWGYTVSGACATTSLYVAVCAPFIFIDRLHVASAGVGLYLALLVSGIWLGSLLASQLIARFSLTRFVVVANAVSVVAAASFLGFVIADLASLLAIVGTMFVFSVGVGAAAPAALVKAISVNPRVTGTASGLYGSVQMAVAGTLVMLAGWGRTRRLPPRPCCLQALWRRLRSGSHETGASRRHAGKRGCVAATCGVTRRVSRAGRGSRSGEGLPWWGAPAREALWRPSGS